MRRFAHPDFSRELQTLLDAVRRGAADHHEIALTAQRITDGDADSWLREWTATAGALWATAGEAHADRHRTNALACYRRAGSYYAAALGLIAQTDGSVGQLDLWRRQRACWDRTVALAPTPGEPIAIAYEDTTLPATFFAAPGAAAGERRPLVILNNGVDEPTSRMWLRGGAAAAERGYHWMTFDGPGQQAALYEQGLSLRPDWEAVLTPVADAMAARPDVDAARMAVIGLGHGGYAVTRALAFEHRFAAAIADPGVVDVSTAWTDPLPDELRAHLAGGDPGAFDREMRLAALFAPETTALLRTRAAPFGAINDSAHQLFERVLAFRLGDEVEAITTPLLITDAGPDSPWAGQSRALHDRLPGAKELVTLTPRVAARRETQLFDWLDGFLR